MLKLKLQYFGTWCKELPHLKRPWCWEGLRAGGEGDDRGWDGWMASPNQWKWVWVNSGVGDGQGGLVCCGSWGRKELDTTERLNWTVQGKSHLFCHFQESFFGLKLYRVWFYFMSVWIFFIFILLGVYWASWVSRLKFSSTFWVLLFLQIFHIPPFLSLQ